jgi:hypothetical protein
MNPALMNPAPLSAVPVGPEATSPEAASTTPNVTPTREAANSRRNRPRSARWQLLAKFETFIEHLS